MHHGLSFLPDGNTDGASATEYYEMLLSLSTLADDAGLSHVKMTEHYLKAYGGNCPSPLIFLAAVAARTTKIRLMTGCLLPVFHHPIQLASSAAMVDAMSGGRLDVGFARAYMPYEFDAFGISMDESQDRFDHTVVAVKQLWGNEEVSVTGAYFSFDEATCLPRPVQPGGPPVWVAAVRSQASFVKAGKESHGLLVTPSLTPLSEMRALIDLYRDNYRARSEGDRPRVLASLPLFIGRTQAHACATADPLLRHYLAVWGASAESWSTRRSTDYAGYTGMNHAIRSFDAERLRTEGGAVVGGVAEVVDRIGSIASALAVDGFLWQVDFGGVDRVTAMGSVERLCQEVIPQLEASSAVEPAFETE